MPQIPGVSEPAPGPPAVPHPEPEPGPPRGNPLLPLILGFFALAVIFIFSSRWIAHTRPAERARPEPTPQIEVPPPPPDPASLLPHANAANPVIATTSQLVKPWSSADFFIRNDITGEEIPATIVRLPLGSAAQSNGYWAFSRKAPYGPCQLEFIKDMEKLHGEYDYRAARHPLVGNPCSRTLYDPLKTANLQGNVWMRGGIVQGGDIRPPFGVELQVKGKEILAVRTE